MESVASFHGSWNSVHLHIKSETFWAVGGRYIQEQPDELFDILCMLADFVRLAVLARSCRALSDQLLAEQCCGRLLRMLIFQRERPGHRQWQCYFRFRVSQILTAQWAGSTRVRFWMFARVLLFIANRLQNILTVKPAKVRWCTNFIATEEKKLHARNPTTCLVEVAGIKEVAVYNFLLNFQTRNQFKCFYVFLWLHFVSVEVERMIKDASARLEGTMTY